MILLHREKICKPQSLFRLDIQVEKGYERHIYGWKLRQLQTNF